MKLKSHFYIKCSFNNCVVNYTFSTYAIMETLYNATLLSKRVIEKENKMNVFLFSFN